MPLLGLGAMAQALGAHAAAQMERSTFEAISKGSQAGTVTFGDTAPRDFDVPVGCTLYLCGAPCMGSYPTASDPQAKYKCQMKAPHTKSDLPAYMCNNYQPILIAKDSDDDEEIEEEGQEEEAKRAGWVQDTDGQG